MEKIERLRLRKKGQILTLDIPSINHSDGTSGTLWEGRYEARLVEDESYLLTGMRDIELKPVRANRVKSPGAYRWSSYRANALGEPDTRVKPHPLTQALGRTRTQRHDRYQALFHAPIRCGWTDRCSSGVPDGHAFGY
jgi:putative transposase